MNKLEVFREITEAIVNGLSSNEREKDQKSNTKYYTKTLSNLLDKLFHYQDEDDEVKEDRRMELVERIIGNNQKSTLNHMKKVLVKRDSIYQEDD